MFLLFTSSFDAAPTSHQAAGALVEGAVSRCQADGADEFGVADWGDEVEESNVIVVCFIVVFRMADDLWDRPGNLIGVTPLLLLPSQVNNQSGEAGAAEGEEGVAGLSSSRRWYQWKIIFFIFVIFYAVSNCSCAKK